MGSTSSLPGLFSLFLASTKTGKVFLHLLQLFPCWQWGSLSYIYTSGLPERKTRGETNRRGGQDMCLGILVRWSQDASGLLDTGKHSLIACKQSLTFVALWRERWDEFSWDFCPWKAVCCNYIILPMLFRSYTSSWQPAFSTSVLVKYFMTEISGLSRNTIQNWQGCWSRWEKILFIPSLLQGHKLWDVYEPNLNFCASLAEGLCL